MNEMVEFRGDSMREEPEQGDHAHEIGLREEGEG